MKLEDIGFYTLSDSRALAASISQPLARCELILTDRCNFHCTYCRGLRDDCRGDMSPWMAGLIIDYWLADGLQNIRFSGGEPTLYKELTRLVRQCRKGGAKRIAISTNGSANLKQYQELLDAGANDFSVSLDSCCAAGFGLMTGGGDFAHVTANIRWLAQRAYTTIGLVVTDDNLGELPDTIEYARGLGVADIRIIPAAQCGSRLTAIESSNNELMPILRYRLQRAASGKPTRGINETDCHRCRLVLDDMAVAGDWHFPCIIYLREGGKPIGEVGYGMRRKREEWSQQHNVYTDPICRYNCLDVCVDYNNKAAGI